MWIISSLLLSLASADLPHSLLKSSPGGEGSEQASLLQSINAVYAVRPDGEEQFDGSQKSVIGEDDTEVEHMNEDDVENVDGEEQFEALISVKGNLTQQDLVHANDHTLRLKSNTKFCLNLHRYERANAGIINLWTCNGHNAQKWIYAGNAIKLFADQRWCLNLHGDAEYDGGMINLWTCTGHRSQQWTWQGSKIAHTVLGIWKAHWCLNLQAYNTANGGTVNLWTCNGHNSQNWVSETHGKLKVNRIRACVTLKFEAEVGTKGLTEETVTYSKGSTRSVSTSTETSHEANVAVTAAYNKGFVSAEGSASYGFKQLVSEAVTETQTMQYGLEKKTLVHFPGYVYQGVVTIYFNDGTTEIRKGNIKIKKAPIKDNCHDVDMR